MPTDNKAPQKTRLSLSALVRLVLYAFGASILSCLAPTHAAISFRVIHTFGSTLDEGENPSGGLTLGADGFLYGTTQNGGLLPNSGQAYGTVFRMTVDGKVTTLHSFGGTDGAFPAATVAFDAGGNLWGSTLNDSKTGLGTLFRIQPNGSFALMYNFKGLGDGGNPQGLTLGRDGNMYGTCYPQFGTIFAITPSGSLASLYGFTGGSDSANPSELALGADGNFYGVTSARNTAQGGPAPGTVFRFSPGAGFKTIYTFTGLKDGSFPRGRLVQGTDGNFYGITVSGGASSPTNGFGTIFKVTASGVLTTLYAFSGGSDGAFPTAGLARGSDNNFYGVTYGGGSDFADKGKGTIFSITPSGTFSSLYLFTGKADAAQPDSPLCLGPNGRLYGTTQDGENGLGDSGNGIAFELSMTGDPPATQRNYEPYTFTTLAGTPGVSGSTDGAISVAQFRSPRGLAIDGSGNLYIADSGNRTIRKITPNGQVTTLAGSARQSGSSDGKGSAARFDKPTGLCLDSAGNIYAADSNDLTGNHAIRRIAPDGVVTTLPGGTARDEPAGIVLDKSGILYVSDFYDHTIRKATLSGTVSLFAGLANTSGSADGAGSAARFRQPFGLAIDSAGNVYVADDGNHAIRKITTGGVVNTLAGNPSIVGQSGNPAGGAVDATGKAAGFSGPRGVAVDAAGNVYVADSDNNAIRKVTAAGVVTTLGGASELDAAGEPLAGSADGTGPLARFDSPNAVVVDASGTLYVADTGNHTIRKGVRAGLLPSPPSIVSQSKSQTVTAGANITLTVTATGTGPFTYQWSKDGAPLPGKTESALALANVQTSDGGSYTVVVSNSGGLVTSAPSVLVVNPPATAPTISSHPQSQTVPLGASVTFRVSAAGTLPLAYQWKLNGTEIPNATSSSYSIAVTKPGDAGSYSVTITNAGGVAQSQIASLSIIGPALKIISLGNKQVKLQFPTSLGSTYHVEYKPYITTNQPPWTVLHTTNGTGGAIEVERSGSRDLLRFFRLRVE